jgi:transcriptional regulator with XRE-family HTH domain
MALSVEDIEDAQPRERPYKLSAERGLFLLVNPNGSKLWRLKYRFGGKEKLLALGAYPDVAVATARQKRDAARATLDAGTDPSAARKAKRRAAEIAEASAFKPAALAYMGPKAELLAPATVEKRLDLNLLRAARALLGWEQPDLAKEAGISISTIRKIEQGTLAMGPETRRRIVQSFKANGLAFIPADDCGGIGVRITKSREMELKEQRNQLQTKLKIWFAYKDGKEDSEALEKYIYDLAALANDKEYNDASEGPLFGTEDSSIPDELAALPQAVLSDLKRLDNINEALQAAIDEDF